ncbi:MAG: SDR family NAD(P)-dependent oxidoreductase [Dehalococcoidia bacterium]|nr:SDR family NAD(P)-dependent oxidoreductase [Dehalococcoidia bacterium]
MYDLKGKVAIVTGAARLRGIGRGCALGLARAGADIVITGTARSPEAFPDDEKKVGWLGLSSVAEEVEAMGRQALAMTSDATNLQDVQALVQATVDRFGHVDILINNAGAPRGKDRAPVFDVPEEEFVKVIMTNLMSTFLCSKYVARQLIKQGQGGKIINMSSISGKRGGRAVAAYDTSKFAIIGFTQSLAMDLAPFKINVNAICPGATDTMRLDDWGLAEARQWGVSHAEAKMRIAVETVPLGRLATVEDVANMAVFLSSSCSDFVTGQSINLCGGRVFY